MADPRTRTPAQYSADLGASVKRAILAASAACDPAWRSITAAALGKSRQRIDDACDLGDDAQLSVRDLLAYPEPIRLALAQMVAGEGRVLVDLPDADECADDWRLAADATEKVMQSAVSFTRAIADGTISAKESDEGIPLADAAVAKLLGVKARFAAASRNRVVGIRRAR